VLITFNRADNHDVACASCALFHYGTQLRHGLGHDLSGKHQIGREPRMLIEVLADDVQTGLKPIHDNLERGESGLYALVNELHYQFIIGVKNSVY
jgi:hypothetical protein